MRQKTAKLSRSCAAQNIFMNIDLDLFFEANTNCLTFDRFDDLIRREKLKIEKPQVLVWEFSVCFYGLRSKWVFSLTFNEGFLNLNDWLDRHFSEKQRICDVSISSKIYVSLMKDTWTENEGTSLTLIVNYGGAIFFAWLPLKSSMTSLMQSLVSSQFKRCSR